MNGDERLDAWMQTATRYFVLANAGGAVAVLSFVGTRSAGVVIGMLAVAALSCFFAGLVTAGIVIGAQLTGAYQAFLSRRARPRGWPWSRRTGQFRGRGSPEI